MQNVKSLRLAMALVVALSLALGGAIACLAVPGPAFAASAKVHKKAGWYVCSLDSSGVKARISGNKLVVKGKLRYGDSPHFPSNGWKKFKKAKHVFKLTKKTKYIFEYTESDTKKTVSKKKFKAKLYSDVTYCSLKVKSGKVVKAILSFN